MFARARVCMRRNILSPRFNSRVTLNANSPEHEQRADGNHICQISEVRDEGDEGGENAKDYGGHQGSAETGVDITEETWQQVLSSGHDQDSCHRHLPNLPPSPPIPTCLPRSLLLYAQAHVLGILKEVWASLL